MSGQLTLVSKLRQRAQAQAQGAAFIFRDQDHGRHVLTWGGLYRLAGRFAAVLHGRGLGRGQLVVNTLVNSPERVLCEAGLWMAGAASVNGHCQMADGSDLLHTIRVSGAAAIFVDPDVTNSPWRVLKNHVTLGKDDSVTSSSLTDLKKIFFIRRVEGGGTEDFTTGLETLDEWFEAEDVTAEDTMTVFTTSGTTGFSKLVVYTHGDALKPPSIMPKGEGTSEKTDSALCAFSIAPLGWIGGYAGMGVVNNHTRVLCDARAGGNPKDMPSFVWKAIREEKCSIAFLTPVLLPWLAQLSKVRHEHVDSASDPSETHKLRLVALGGMPITKAMVEAALSLAHVVIVGYGATDFNHVSGHFMKDSETFVDHDAGPVAEGVTVKIVSQDDEDRVLPVNQVGHILVKRSVRNQGQLGQVTTEDLFTKDGFYRTGDMGRLDERGHLIVDGRGSDAIMRGPYIFYPSWIESRIKSCPGVDDVIVVGVPDPFLNEELCACVVLNSDVASLDQVRQFVERDVLTSEDDPLSPRPRYYLQFEAFPKTDTGKTSRKIVKAQAAGRIQKASDSFL